MKDINNFMYSKDIWVILFTDNNEIKKDPYTAEKFKLLQFSTEHIRTKLLQVTLVTFCHQQKVTEYCIKYVILCQQRRPDCYKT